MGMIINPYLVQPSGPSYGTLTTAWIAATGETDLTILGALNTLESDLTTYGLTAKIKALWPFCGGTASKHKFNFMDARDLDAAFRLVFSGGLTHDSNGIKGNATNAYYDTKFNPSVHLTSSTGGSAFLYCNNSVADNGADLAANQSGVNTRFQVMASYAGSFYASMLATNLYSASNTATVGFFGATREPSNTTSFYAVKDTNSYSYSDSFANPNSNVAGLCVCTDSTSFAYFTGRRHSFSCMGEGLTTTQAQNLRTAVIAFNTTLGR